jgi:glycosyltransferase involved in cell wall biosynthesis
MSAYTVVVPTLGRPCLGACLEALARARGPAPAEVVVVHDGPDSEAGRLPTPARLTVRGLTSGGRGPAAARNTGWRTAATDWVVFLDDDVRVSADWAERLAEDLAAADARTAGVQGRIRVRLPQGRRPTDWERGTAGLEHAAWATADMAYRLAALREVGGFDERFRRAFREDADIALRMLDAGWALSRGERVTEHPVRPAGPWISVRSQRGNADDALMRALHGPDWWERARAPRGRLPRHAAVTLAGLS